MPQGEHLGKYMTRFAEITVKSSRQSSNVTFAAHDYGIVYNSC